MSLPAVENSANFSANFEGDTLLLTPGEHLDWWNMSGYLAINITKEKNIK